MNPLNKAFQSITFDVIELWLLSIGIAFIFFLILIWIITVFARPYSLKLLDDYKEEINKIKGELNAIREKVIEDHQSPGRTD